MKKTCFRGIICKHYETHTILCFIIFKYKYKQKYKNVAKKHTRTKVMMATASWEEGTKSETGRPKGILSLVSYFSRRKLR